MTFRIYALPGSGAWWLIDLGPGTAVSQARFWYAAKTRSAGGANLNGVHPHKWIEIDADSMHIFDDTAYFTPAMEVKP